MKDSYQTIIDEEKIKLNRRLAQINRRQKRFFILSAVIITTIAVRTYFALC